MKLLVIGDSFSASTHADSWVNQLDHDVYNLSTNGSSEYRIWKKLSTVDQSTHDLAVIVHTSPNRIYTKHNPLYPPDHSHKHCDLIYTDLEDKRGNKFADGARWWFENVFDLESAEDIHQVLVEDCIRKCTIPTIHITFFDLYFAGTHNFYHIWIKNKGNINHMNLAGNKIVAQKVDILLKKQYNKS